ncbi:MAG: sigma-70 family RNA polymerase sigma factor [Actinomycetes bacterium]
MPTTRDLPTTRPADTAADLDEPTPSADLVRVYLTEIGRHDLLTAEEEVDLSKRIEAGLYATHLLRRAEAGEGELDDGAERAEMEALAEDGQAAKARMLRGNLRLVVSIATKLRPRGVPFLDVVQEGNLGLIRAVEKFDYRKGYKFSTYATWWIRQAIGRGVAEQARTIRLPVHVSDNVRKLSRVERNLSQDLGRAPTLDELSVELDESVERVEYLKEIARDTVSLDTPVGDDQDTVLGDLVSDPGELSASDVLENQAMAAELSRLVDTLPERQAYIVRMRHGLHDGRTHTFDEISGHVGLTRERVRQLEKDAIARLRHPSVAERLLDWAS